MNIWEAYCKPSFYNIYFGTLVAKGMSRESAENLKRQYCTYLQRIKGTRFAKELKLCTTQDELKEKLHEIFYDKWRDNMKYKEMPFHYEAYLGFLDSMQALHNDFISESDKQRLIDPDPEIPIKCLTSYELDYLKDGKLVALMNPQLLSILKEYIEEERLVPRKAMLICETFYGNLLPDMELEDYSALINYLWNASHKVKNVSRRSHFKIIYPDGTEQITSTTDGMKRVILFYGIEEVRSKKFSIRNEDFIVKNIPVGKEAKYEIIEGTAGVCITGDSKDRMNVLRAINISLGNKLKIEWI